MAYKILLRPNYLAFSNINISHVAEQKYPKQITRGFGGFECGETVGVLFYSSKARMPHKPDYWSAHYSLQNDANL